MKSIFTATLLLPLAAAMCILSASCSGGGSGYRHEEGMAWGTVYHITYRSGEDLAADIAAAIAEVNATLSPFVDTSEISLINRGGLSLPGENFRQVFALSQHVCSISGGAFDPTVAPLVNLWGFGYGQAAAHNEPTDSQIDSAMKSVGMLDCYIDSAGLIHKKSDLTEFNFSAIAKGYGVDLISSALSRRGCGDYMVEVGGEIRVAGANPRGGLWRIQRDAPVADTSGVAGHARMAVAELTDCSIATSGNYRNFHVSGGRAMGHTISPATGRPVQTSVLSATVKAPTCALADALATAAMALGDSAAMAMMEAVPEAEALLVVACGDSAKMVATPGFYDCFK